MHASFTRTLFFLIDHLMSASVVYFNELWKVIYIYIHTHTHTYVMSGSAPTMLNCVAYL